MTERPQNTVMLKILSGLQSGVDVSLVDGTYILGSGDDADIQILDVSIRPDHAKLVIRSGDVSIQALSGPVHLRSRGSLSAGSDPCALRPLEVVTAGTTRFVVAPLTADWTLSRVTESIAPRRLLDRPLDVTRLWGEHRMALVGAVAGLMLLGFWIVPHMMAYVSTLGGRLVPAHEETLSAALRSLDFASHLKIRRKNGGTLHVDGVVNRPDERQAVADAIRQTGVPAATHILVLESLRDELATMLAADAPHLRLAVSREGALTLAGVVRDEVQATALIQTVKGMAGDAVPIRSTLQTHDDLLADVNALGRRAQIARSVQFHLSDRMVEAEGAVALAQLDEWAGFLQSYNRQFAPYLPLRSLVRLQDAAMTVEGSPIYLGVDTPSDGRAIDPDRLASGTYTAADLLIGGEAAGKGPAETVAADQHPAPVATRVASAEPVIDLGSLLKAGDAPAAGLDALAWRAIELFDSKQFGSTAAGSALQEVIGQMEDARDRAPAPLARYRALLKPGQSKPRRACWPGSAVQLDNVTGALFWLDLLSHDTRLSTASLGSDNRAIIAEAALNPIRVSACAHLASDGRLTSSYLDQASREPLVARLALRDFPAAGVTISGLSLPGTRYFQSPDNRIFQEGTQTDARTRVLAIGELGVLFSSGAGLSVSFIDDNLAWQTN